MMQSEDRLSHRIRQAEAAGRKTLIPFLPAGFPDMERFWNELRELDAAGADIIEIGIPFSDPVADGPTVEEASQECLQRGATLGWLLDGLKRERARLRAEVVLMGYVNPFWQFGWERLASEAAEAGVAGLIVPDLPLEESEPIEPILEERGIVLLRLVGLNTSLERMRLYAEKARGFVYFVAVMGTTGSRDAFPPQLLERLQKAREIFSQPIALGFGISRPQQLEPLQECIDAVVFGSSLIQHLRGGGTSREFMARWQQQE